MVSPHRWPGVDERRSGRERCLSVMSDGVARSLREIAFLAKTEVREAGNAMRGKARFLAGGLYRICPQLGAGGHSVEDRYATEPQPHPQKMVARNSVSVPANAMSDNVADNK